MDPNVRTKRKNNLLDSQTGNFGPGGGDVGQDLARGGDHVHSALGCAVCMQIIIICNIQIVCIRVTL